jgi:hypothetical protein
VHETGYEILDTDQVLQKQLCVGSLGRWLNLDMVVSGD